MLKVWRPSLPPSASNPLCVCIIGSYTPLPSSVLIIDDLFFLSVFFSFHYPLRHYFCQINRIICCSVSHENFFSNRFPGNCLESNSLAPVKCGWDSFWDIAIIVIYKFGGLAFVFNSQKLHGHDFNKVGCSNQHLYSRRLGESLETPKTCLKYVISLVFYHHWNMEPS